MRKFNASYDNMGFDKVENHYDTGTKYNFGGLAIQQRRLNKKLEWGIFESNSNGTRNILGWRY